MGLFSPVFAFNGKLLELFATILSYLYNIVEAAIRAADDLTV